MGLVYSRTDSGLVLAEHGADEASVARALREHDSELRLVRQASDTLDCLVWKVYRYAGSERPAEFLCAWADARGEPLPLSHRLVEMVKGLDRNTRAASLDVDVANAQKREREERHFEQEAAAVIDDWRGREKRSAMLPRGQSLRRARAKQRAKGLDV